MGYEQYRGKMNQDDKEPEQEQWLEDITKHAPVVVPIVGAVLMFVLAFIAIKMA